MEWTARREGSIWSSIAPLSGVFVDNTLMTRTLIFRLRHVPQPLDGRPRKGIARNGVGVALEGCRLTNWTLVEVRWSRSVMGRDCVSGERCALLGPRVAVSGCSGCSARCGCARCAFCGDPCGVMADQARTGHGWDGGQVSKPKSSPTCYDAT